MICMIMSGWGIYIASSILRFMFPEWATIGGWLGGALNRIGADRRARYVGFKCFDDYFAKIDMALDYGNSPLSPAYGAPLTRRHRPELGRLLGEPGL